MRALALLAGFALVACHEHAGGHDHAPRYGGRLVELGDHEFQVEFLLHPETGKLAAYLWDGHVERAVPAAMASMTVHATVGGETVAVELKPVENAYAKGEAGKSSEYEGFSEKLRGVEEFEGRLASITLAQKTFENVAFHYHPPGGGDHDHDHDQ